MKKNLKKYLSLAMVLLFAISSFGTLSVAAENSGVDPLDSNLVIHYDFEGTDFLDAIKDKAPSGSVADDLQPIAGAVNFLGITIDNSVGTFTHTMGSAGLICNTSDDTKTVMGESTWFVRTRLKTYDSNQYFEILDMRVMGSQGSRPFALLYDKTAKQICVGISPSTAANKAQNHRFNYEYDLENSSKWLNIAVVVQNATIVDETTGQSSMKYQVTAYVSSDLPTSTSEWTNLGTSIIGEEIAAVLDTGYLKIGSFGANDSALGVTLDDVRLYNRSLTLDEIATIIPNGSFYDGINDDTDNSDTDAKDTDIKDTVGTESPVNYDTSKTTTKNDTTSGNTSDTNKGCGSSISLMSVALMIILVTGFTVAVKKKFEN